MLLKNKILLLILSTSFLLFSLCFCSMQKIKDDENEIVDYRKEMRNFIVNISKKAKKVNQNFIVIPQNGQEVAWQKDNDKIIDEDFFSAIDGTGREDMFYGYEKDNEATEDSVSKYFIDVCNVYKNRGKVVLATDYCNGENSKLSYEKNSKNGYISFSATERNLNVIPEETPNNMCLTSCTDLSNAKNFLYIINEENYTSNEDFISAIDKTFYDAIIMDACNLEGNFFSAKQIVELKSKPNNASRLVIAYMSIGEAEDYRWYWNADWGKNPPVWLEKENPNWKGNYEVRYWNKEWQSIICDAEDSYLEKF